VTRPLHPVELAQVVCHGSGMGPAASWVWSLLMPLTEIKLSSHEPSLQPAVSRVQQVAASKIAQHGLSSGISIWT
jgi:hypothetical protein